MKPPAAPPSLAAAAAAAGAGVAAAAAATAGATGVARTGFSFVFVETSSVPNTDLPTWKKEKNEKKKSLSKPGSLGDMKRCVSKIWGLRGLKVREARHKMQQCTDACYHKPPLLLHAWPATPPVATQRDGPCMGRVKVRVGQHITDVLPRSIISAKMARKIIQARVVS